MKWSFVIQQKLKAALLLSGVMVFITLISLFARNSMNSIDQSFSSIYQDRLIPAIDIVYLSEHLYSKRLLLERELSSKQTVKPVMLAQQLYGHNQKIDLLIIAFEKTFLVEGEIKTLETFKNHIKAYTALEMSILQLNQELQSNACSQLFYGEGALLFQQTIQQLSELTKIQSVVGHELMKNSHTEALYFNLLSTLQIAIAIIIAFIILGLVHSSKIINQDKTPFHLN